jgi:hypothetical protein
MTRYGRPAGWYEAIGADTRFEVPQTGMRPDHAYHPRQPSVTTGST